MRSTEVTTAPRQQPESRTLTTAVTLIGLGLSILFLNSWDNLVVRISVGLFWGTFLLVLNGPDVVKTFRRLAKKNDNRRASYKFSPER